MFGACISGTAGCDWILGELDGFGGAPSSSVLWTSNDVSSAGAHVGLGQPWAVLSLICPHFISSVFLHKKV
jgi:hypothetical protein